MVDDELGYKYKSKKEILKLFPVGANVVIKKGTSLDSYMFKATHHSKTDMRLPLKIIKTYSGTGEIKRITRFYNYATVGVHPLNAFYIASFSKVYDRDGVLRAHYVRFGTYKNPFCISNHGFGWYVDATEVQRDPRLRCDKYAVQVRFVDKFIQLEYDTLYLKVLELEWGKKAGESMINLTKPKMVHIKRGDISTFTEMERVEVEDLPFLQKDEKIYLYEGLDGGFVESENKDKNHEIGK
jgi:ASC-1-like (ASCH) protein